MRLPAHGGAAGAGIAELHRVRAAVDMRFGSRCERECARELCVDVLARAASVLWVLRSFGVRGD